MMKLRLFSKKKIAHIRNMICTQTRFVSSGGRKQPTHRQTITMFLIPHRECPSTLHMCVHVCSYMCTVQGWTETTHVEDSCYNASIITTCLLYVLLYWHGWPERQSSLVYKILHVYDRNSNSSQFQLSSKVHLKASTQLFLSHTIRYMAKLWHWNNQKQN